MTPDGVRTIDQLAVMLLSNPNLSVTVTGHTVMVGTDLGWCQRLSELRADAVAERLQTYGIAPSRLHTRGVSHHQPLDSPTASRRADVVVHA